MLRLTISSARKLTRFLHPGRVNGKHPDHPVPHVGPGLQDYHDWHAQTVGGQEGSDDWWRKVSFTVLVPPALGRAVLLTLSSSSSVTRS